MGWLFGKKKSKVPFPEPRLADERALQFPGRSAERIIEPDQLKAMAGVERSMSPFPEQNELPLFSLPTLARPYSGPKIQELPESSASDTAVPAPEEPLFIHVNVYRQVLGSIDDLKRNVNSLQETCKHLEVSEYNEEANFTKLRRAVKSMHDRLLQMDKILFKSQGM